MKSKKDKLENELLNLKNLVAIILADIDTFLLRDETQTKDKNVLHNKYEIRNQLHTTGQKIVNTLSDCGYNIDEPLKRKFLFNQ